MDLRELIVAGIRGSMFLFVFCLGLATTVHERFYVVRHPGRIFRSLFAMNIVMPLIAVGISKGFDLPGTVRLALIALSVSPVPPIIPSQQLKAGGDPSYIFGLLISAVAFSVLFVPFAIEGVARLFGFTVLIPAREIAMVISLTVLIPMASGVLVRHLAPSFAKHYARRLSQFALVLLVLSALPIVVVAGPTIVLMARGGALTAIILFCAMGLAVGHILGGPTREHRKTLALATSSRHPGVALAISTLAFPEAKSAVAAILLVLIVGGVANAIYLKMGIRPARVETKQRDDLRLAA